jgi:hypothetical protein
MRRDEVVLDDVKIDAILGWAVNTRNAGMGKGDDRDCAKVGLAGALQDACLAYINRVETERQVERLKEEVSRLTGRNYGSRKRCWMSWEHGKMGRPILSSLGPTAIQ